MSNPKWVDGQFGKALEFDGTNFVDMGNDESLQFDGDVTIVCWVRPENVAGVAKTSFANHTAAKAA